MVLAAALLLVALLWAGTYVVMFDYPLTRDEHMVLFDGASYAAGKMAEPRPAEWAGFATALVPDFLIETEGSVLLVSLHLPGNAAARAVFAKIADPALFSPLMVAAGLVVLWDIAERLFPDHPQVRWLALFLKDRWWSHGCAMVVGVLAMGLHQFVFHPLFAAPFVLWLLVQRRWALVLAYGAAYGAGLMLWLAWPTMVVQWGGVTIPVVSEQATLGGVIETRILPKITRIDPRTLELMADNLVRLLAWNAIFLLPFLLALGPALRRREPIVLALAGGVVLTLAAVAILLPYQGHGWGYRYIHGLIGSLVLLAGFGYRELARRESDHTEGAAAVMLAASALVMVPAALLSAHRFVEPHARLHGIVTAQQTDFVIVDDLAYPAIIDEVRNRADLSNRPLVFSRYHLGDDRIGVLCSRGSVAVVGAQAIAEVELAAMPTEARPLDLNPCKVTR